MQNFATTSMTLWYDTLNSNSEVTNSRSFLVPIRAVYVIGKKKINFSSVFQFSSDLIANNSLKCTKNTTIRFYVDNVA